jgi:kynurenine 3-monooxygenase
MVPFYGQGLNAGFEDLNLLFSLFPKSGPIDLTEIFERYTTIRTPDAHTICDLALHNYHEMASGVISPAYKVRKAVEDGLYRYARWTGIVPLYTMVSFGGLRYSDVRKKWIQQGRLLNISAWIGSVGILALAGYNGRRFLNR